MHVFHPFSEAPPFPGRSQLSARAPTSRAAAQRWSALSTPAAPMCPRVAPAMQAETAVEMVSRGFYHHLSPLCGTKTANFHVCSFCWNVFTPKSSKCAVSVAALLSGTAIGTRTQVMASAILSTGMYWLDVPSILVNCRGDWSSTIHPGWSMPYLQAWVRECSLQWQPISGFRTIHGGMPQMVVKLLLSFWGWEPLPWIK